MLFSSYYFIRILRFVYSTNIIKKPETKKSQAIFFVKI
jgi:hypothetical protein